MVAWRLEKKPSRLSASSLKNSNAGRSSDGAICLANYYTYRHHFNLGSTAVARRKLAMC